MRIVLSICLHTLPALVLACATDDPGPPYRVEVLATGEVDPATELAPLELTVRELDLADLDSLRGPSFEVLRGGTLRAREVQGSIVSDGRFTGAAPLDLRYRVEDGVVVARDFTTLMLFTFFHNAERVLAAVPDVAGVTVAELSATRGFQFLFEPTLSVELGGSTQTQTVKSNAFYVPGENQLAVARRSALERVPIAASLPILAHEMGHRLFERSFFHDSTAFCQLDDPDPVVATSSRLAAEWAGRGLNEGFADFMSFTITGGTDTLLASIGPDTERSLVNSTFDWDTIETCPSIFYCEGTLFARSFYQAFLALGGDPASSASRAAYGRVVNAAMRQTVDRLIARGSLPAVDALVCTEAGSFFPPPRDYIARVLGAIVDAIVAGLPAEQQGAHCAALFDNLGQAGFPPETRITCAAK